LVPNTNTRARCTGDDEYLLTLLLTGVSLHPPAPKGGPTRTSADASVPRLAGFSLIT
jgi:hypothetical protein